MSGDLGTAVLTLATDNDKLKRGLDDAERETSGWGSRIGGIAKTAILGLTGVAAVGIGLSIKAAADAEKISAETSAVLISTQGVAGMTYQAVNDLATSLSRVTPFEDDVVQGAENMLLTFTSIGKDVFPQATETVLNMSTALGQDTTSSAIQLGKALNDPINGVTALRRVGVSFTEAQLEQIRVLQESGDLMGAQKIILNELGTEFGGAAKAAGETFAGQLAILKGQVGNVAEAVGGPLIGALTGLLGKVMPVISAFADGLPAAMDRVGGAIELTVGVFSDLFGILSGRAPEAGGALRAAFGDMAEPIAKVTATLREVKDFIVMTFFGGVTQGADLLAARWQSLFGTEMPGPVRQAVEIVGNLINGIGAVVERVMAHDIVGALTAAFGAWGEFKRGVVTLLVDLIPAASALLNDLGQKAVSWITTVALPGLQAELPKILASLMDFLVTTGDKLVNGLIAFGTAFIAWVLPAIPPLLTELLGLASTLLKWIGDHSEEIGAKLIEWGMKFGAFIFGTAIPEILKHLPGILLTIGTWVLTEAIPGVLRIFVGLGKGIISGILEGLGSLKTEVGNAIGSAIREAFESIDIQVGPFHISGRGGVTFTMPSFNIPNPFAGGGTATSSSTGPASSSSTFTANLNLDGQQIASVVGDRTAGAARMSGAGI